MACNAPGNPINARNSNPPCLGLIIIIPAINPATRINELVKNYGSSINPVYIDTHFVLPQQISSLFQLSPLIFFFYREVACANLYNSKDYYYRNTYSKNQREDKGSKYNRSNQHIFKSVLFFFSEYCMIN